MNAWKLPLRMFGPWAIVPAALDSRTLPSTISVVRDNLARVGLNEFEAKSRGLEYRVAKMPMAAVLCTRTLSKPRGCL